MKAIGLLLREYWLLLLVVLGGFVIRLQAIRTFDFISDNGTEFYVLQLMKTHQCWPLVGPLLGVENVYIPPTYFYILYFIQWLAQSPSQMVIFFAASNSLAILFLSLAIWTITNKKTALIAALLLHFSYALFLEGTYIWHPQPVSMFFSLGLWLLLLAQKKNSLQLLSIGIISYLVALSTHPSPLPFLPFFLVQTTSFFVNRQPGKIVKSMLNTIFLFAITGLPLFASQLYFEYINGFPTFKTIFVDPDLSQPAFIVSSLSWENGLLILKYFVSRTMGIAHTITNSNYELSMWLVAIGVLIALAIKKSSWRWPSFFPYSLLVAMVILMQFHDRELLFWSANHRFMPTLLFLFFAVADTWHRLKKSRLAQIILMGLLVLFLHNNIRAHYYRWQQISEQNNLPESYRYKQKLILVAKENSQKNNYRLADTLLLHKNFAAADYNDHVDMQYYAMEYWTLADYEFLVPPINFSCNQFNFFTVPQLRQQAKQIILIEPAAADSPDRVFGQYIQAQVWRVDDQTKLVVYETTASSL